MTDKYPALRTELPRDVFENPMQETLVVSMRTVGEHMGWDWSR
jgi:hypothetical protein